MTNTKIESGVGSIIATVIEHLGAHRQVLASLYTESTYFSWTQGDSCPDCGHTEVDVIAKTNDRYGSAAGIFRFRESGDGGDELLHALCPRCETVLYQSPAWKAMNDV